MTAAEFKVLRESMGLTTSRVAELMGIAERSVQRWEDVVRPIPDARAAELVALTRRTDEAVAELVEYITRYRPGVVLTYRIDWPVSAAESPDGVWSAAWHRAVVDRAVRAAGEPRPRIGYGDVDRIPKIDEESVVSAAKGLVAQLPNRPDVLSDALGRVFADELSAEELERLPGVISGDLDEPGRLSDLPGPCVRALDRHYGWTASVRAA